MVQNLEKYFNRSSDNTWRKFKGNASGGGGGTDPVVTGQTRFGFNTDNWSRADSLMQTFGKVPVARAYSSSLTSDGSMFAPGGKIYKAAGKHLAGVVSSQVVNLSYTNWDVVGTTSSTSPVANTVRNFVNSIPAGWQIQLVLQHEYNLHTQDMGGDKRDPYTMAQYINAFKILAGVIYDADPTGQKCFAVINPSGDVSWSNSYSPTAAQCPPHTQFHWDLYDQPNGIGGYKAYGHPYRSASSLCADRIQSIVDLGFMSTTYGWGLDELGATQRVAPKLATLDTRLGWGPNSPYDLDATQRVASIQGIVDYCLAQPVKPSTILHFTFNGTGSGNWNHDWYTAGRHTRGLIITDDYTIVNGSEVQGPNYQGFPINLSTAATNRMLAMVQAQIDSSPL